MYIFWHHILEIHLTYILTFNLAFFVAYLYLYHFIYIIYTYCKYKYAYIVHSIYTHIETYSDIAFGILFGVHSEIQSLSLCSVLSDIWHSLLRSGRWKHAETTLMKSRAPQLAYVEAKASPSPSSS